MANEFKVIVVADSERRHFMMRYHDPMSGKPIKKSTGVERSELKRDRVKAERVAAQWEAELREGRYHAPLKVTWAEFRERYENEVLASLADTTDRKVSGVFNSIEQILNPGKLAELTAARLSFYQSKLRERGAAENTIKGHTAHLNAALAWAMRVGLLAVMPTIERPRRAKGSKMMKGRPIAGEEFDRLLAKVESVVGPDAALSWRHYLAGLWLSGLRLAESLELYWDRDDKLCVDLGGKRPMLRIPAELEKGNKDRLLPMAPEFAEFLVATPEAERAGRVFSPKPRRAKGSRMTEQYIGKVVSAIGKAAAVKVNTSPKGKVKYASAHDLRRSFGERWSTRVMPQVLMELMRHESMETTLKFYVGRNAQATADVLWVAHEQQKTVIGPTLGPTELENNYARLESNQQPAD